MNPDCQVPAQDLAQTRHAASESRHPKDTGVSRTRADTITSGVEEGHGLLRDGSALI